MSVFIKDLPESVNCDLCKILDTGEVWRKLAGRMNFSPSEINEIDARRGYVDRKSASCILLERWGQYLHDTNELFILLYHIENVPAMRCLAKYVELKCLRLLQRLEDKYTLDENRNQNQSTTHMSPEQIGEAAQKTEAGVKRNLEVSSDLLQVTSSENVTTPSNIVQCRNEVFKDYSPIVPYSELCTATNNWDEQHIVGKGGFGRVYIGKWKETIVAIKKLNGQGMSEDFLRELCLNRYRHDNIVPLYGYSLNPCVLVYQFMSEGSLKSKLRPRSSGDLQRPLAWPQRLRVAVGVARGLQFLHTLTVPPLIHGDIKPENILLDQCLEPKIADFGLARLGPDNTEEDNHMVSKLQGTHTYIPLDYVRTLKLCPAVDVYSFGVVLLEIATGLRPVDASRGADGQSLRNLVHNAYQKDGNYDSIVRLMQDQTLIAESCSKRLCYEVLKTGHKCTTYHARDRPDMVTVYQELNILRLS